MAGEIMGLPTPLVMLSLGAMLATGLVAYTLLVVVGGTQARVDKRMKKIARRARGELPAARTARTEVSLRRSTSDSGIKVLDAAIKRYLPRPELMRRRLARTGVNIQLGTYVLVNVILIGGMAVAFMAMWQFTLTLALFLAVPLGLGLPHLTIGFLIARRRAKFMSLFPDAIDLIVRGLKSGLPVPESIRTVSQEIGDPVGTEFANVMDYVHLGNTLEEALWTTAERLDISEFRFFVVSIAVQRETGGNLGETLENLGDILRKRKQAKLKVKALSAEARASAFIIGGLPFAMALTLYTLSPDYILPLFTDPRGIAMLIGGGLWMAIGIGVMWKMVRFEI
ncbi:MAG: pilus assembly protein TadB [Deinococcus-Thermus bacterium]|jgi:tight adherence protein B|nr:pilus assembly protein TadB [Deinococcota bacterium]